ncbi:XK-related protein 8-like [Silurus asotus]|uniref:XK-related protein n=1 Tax=Silurus asotus TaxID=30991 RepID=A0AAD5ASN4_SILAS|nr:XK-related protein 8-like [Silurus asotus]
MEEGFPFHFLWSDVIFSVLSLFLFLVDIALDVWAIVSLYEEQKYFSMGLLICILLSSSVLLQIFSWLWYTDSSKNLETNVEKFISRHGLMNIVHIFQLGVFVRFAAVMEISITSIKHGELLKEGIAVYQNHDLSMLRLFEAFSESSPQLILMMALIIEMPELHFFTVIKILASLSSLSFTVLSFHRNMRALVPQKFRMGWTSSVIYFLWNLLLIGPRVVCVSLFASVLPCYIAAHFLSLWMLLFLWAWWQNTDFMDTKSGEWLYRATVGLIWYFSWFNVTSGNTKHKGIIYHVVMVMDMMLLLGLWWWRRSVELARLSPLPINPYLLIALLMSSYILGILLRLVYYWKFHPKQRELQLHEKEKEPQLNTFLPKETEVRVELELYDENLQYRARNMIHSLDPIYCNLVMDSVIETEEPKPKIKIFTVTPPIQRDLTGVQKRMKNMAGNFYC